MSPVASALFSEPIQVITITEDVGPSGRMTRSSSVVNTTGAFRQRVAADAFNDGVVVTDEVAVYLPPESVVMVGDQLGIRGEVYEVVSTGFPQVNFRTGSAHHLEVRARRSQR